MIRKLSSTVTCWPAQEESSVVVVWVPQLFGVISGALLPPLKCSFISEKGSCGFSSKEAVRRPVSGSVATLPGIFTLIPRSSFSTTR